MKMSQHWKNFNLFVPYFSILVLTLVFLVSVILVPEFSQVFASANIEERPDLILMGIDDPDGSNQFRYKVGRNLDSNGQASDWNYIEVDNPGLGDSNDGGGAAIAYINDNDTPDLVLMGIDAPGGINNFWYTIGWDLNSNGQASSWSGRETVGGIGDHTSGGGVAVGYINKNDIPDLIFMGVDNPSKDNHFRYKIGWDIDYSGKVSSWSGRTETDGIGWDTQGGGAGIAYIDSDSRPDLVLMGVNDHDGANAFRYRIGWNLGYDGQASDWSYIQVDSPKLGHRNDGGGAAIAYINDNNTPDLVFMGIDEPDGTNNFWYAIGWDVNSEENSNGQASSWSGIEYVEGIGSVTDGGGVAFISEPLMKTQLIEPPMGSNGKVNVALEQRTKFEVSVEPDIGSIEKSWWKEVTGNAKTEKEYSSPITDPKKFFTFSETGEKTVYCKVAVKIDERQEELNPIEIPIHVWERPIVDDSPPSEAINAGTVSWYDGKYVGVVDEPVRLMADVSEDNLNDNESIDKYLWDFDNDWETVELQQPNGKVVSYIWDRANLNGTIRCKAVTNYGIKSEEKKFELKIYNPLQIDPGDSYTGRPKKSVQLEATINTNSYPGASFEYQWRVNSGMPDYSLKNAATQQQDYFQLTPKEDSKNGQLEYVDLPLSDNWSVTGEFYTGDGNGADAFYIYVWANETLDNEDEDKGQYSINYDEYQDEIQLKSSGSTLKAVAQPNLDNSEWHSFHVDFDRGVFRIYLDHHLKLEYNDGDNYQNRMSNNLFGFGARTGGLNNYHNIRNMKWSTGETVDTDSQGIAEYTWMEEGIHKVNFTATVTTAEGLVIADSQVTEVVIEAGKPTAMPGSPYRGGIAGGNFTPIQFEGNPPDFVEDEDIGHIDEWVWFFPDEGNSALELDGQNNHVIVDSVSDFPTSAITVEFWMKSSDSSREGTPVSYASSTFDNDFLIANHNNFYSIVANEKIEPYRVIDGEESPLNISTNDGNWHHIAVTWKSSNGEFTLYKDGAKEFSGNVAEGKSITGSGAFVIGQEQDSMGGGFDLNQAFAGAIDEVRVWNFVRTENEIRNNMGRKLDANKESGLVLYWNMEELESADGLLVDESSSGNDGTLSDDFDLKQAIVAGHPVVVQGIWNPVYQFAKDGEYAVGLKVRSEYGKWSYLKTAKVQAIDGKIAGYVRAADLRTPVRNVRLTFKSSHVDPDILRRIATYDDVPIFDVGLNPFSEELNNLIISEGLKQNFEDNGISLSNGAKVSVEKEGSEWLIIDKQEYMVKKEDELLNIYNEKLRTNSDGYIYTVTDKEGYYSVEHIPLGSYRVIASKKEGDTIHEFETKTQATELTLNAPEQNAIDFVDLSVFPISGRIVYSIQKNGEDVFVKDVMIKAQAVSSTNTIESLLSTKSQNADGGNYNMPLFSGKYLFKAEREGHDIRIKEDTPDYNPDTTLVTIDRSRTDIDFIDYTTRELTVFVEDSGGNPIAYYPGNFSNAGDAIIVSVSGNNGQEEGSPDDDEGKFVVELNPGTYTVRIEGAEPEEKEVDLISGDDGVTMTIPVQIELTISPQPKLFDVEDEFLEQFGLSPEDNPEGYMFYYPPEPRTHTYTIEAKANGYPVEDFFLFVTDEISMMTENPPVEQEIQIVSDKDEEGNKTEYTITAGYPKMNRDLEPPLAAPKWIKFRAEKDGYENSDTMEEEVTVLGDVSVGSAQRIVSVPIVNYTVLHDPPGDGSYSYLDDSMTVKGIVSDMTIEIEDDETIPVYPSPWRDERSIDDFDFEKEPGTGTKSKDLGSKGLLGYREPDGAEQFTWMAVVEMARGGVVSGLAGPFAYLAQIANMGASYGIINGVGIQYEVSPNRHLQTPSGDKLPDLLGPGKGDVYFGEGWTLGLQQKYRLGIELVDDEWQLKTYDITTYDILDRTNQYLYTIRDIENIINDLQASIDDLEEDGLTDDEKDEKDKLKSAKSTWEDLLDKNLAYEWKQNLYSDSPESFEEFEKRNGLTNNSSEMLIFSAGPSFEYSRKIAERNTLTISMSVGPSTSGELGTGLKLESGFRWFGTGITVEFKAGGTASIGTSTGLSAAWECGKETEQTVGFVLNDDDIGDNIATRVYVDPQWGTPIFFHDPGSYTSDPWEPGTNKAVDFTLELLEDATGPFDYHDGAHYEVKLTYTGQRELESSSIAFLLYASAASNTDNLTFRFNGDQGPYSVYLSQDVNSATIDVSVYPPEADKDNSEEKEYPVVIGAIESADVQISSKIERNIMFADFRAPRATVTAPYEGERVSPVFFPEDEPFDIEVVSENTDLASLKLQISSKQPDGVWEPWYDLSGMVWEDGGDNENITLFDRLDREPPRREFTFKWKEDAIKNLGVGEYSLRAVATDKAGNVDLDPPFVVFQVDDSKPIVLTTNPDYQSRDSERIYRGELSVIFNDDMRADDFDDRTFYVTDLLKGGEKVAGYVSYSPALRKAVFVPIQPFQPNGFYRVEVKTDKERDDGTVEKGLHDLAGNPLDSAFMWTFRTKDAPFEPTWSITLRATNGLSTDDNNIAAVKYGADDGEDEKDARAVPSMASQLRLSFLNRDKVEFERDTRPADGRLSHHWFFVVNNAENGSDVTISYKPSLKLTRTTRQYQNLYLVEFDADGNVTNRIKLEPSEAPINDETGEIGYIDAYTYTNQGEGSRYFRLDVQKVNLVATELQVGSSGWKFLSVPIAPQRVDPFVNLGDDIEPFQLYRYDTETDSYKIYPLDLGEVSLQTGHGYFTRLENDVEVDVGGVSNQDDVEVKLNAKGWNAIGNPFILPVDIASLKFNDQTFDEAVSNGLIEETLYRWNINPEESDAYDELTVTSQLEPWDACWLKTKQEDITLIIPAPEGLTDAESPLPGSYEPPMSPSNVVDLAIHSEQVLDKGEFDLKFALTSDFASDLTTTLGTRKNAKISYDQLDRSEPPTLGQTVALYFSHSDWEKGSGLYNRDYQPLLEIGESRTWQFTAFTDKPNTKMTLSWNTATESLPDDIMFYFRQAGETEWQDMRKVKSIKLASTSLITKNTFEVRAERFEMSPPEELSVIADEGQVKIKWAAKDNPFITGYELLRSTQDDIISYAIRNTKHEFLDADVIEEATYTYQLITHFKSGAELKSELFTVTVLPVTEKTVLLQSYPNPFNPEVWIPYELESESEVEITIYNISGELIRKLELGVQTRGSYISKEKAAYWDGQTQTGERASSGIYFYVMRTDNFVSMRKMVILK